MGVLENLEPKKVWTIFEQICQVPHPSKKEGKIIEFLMNFAAENGLEAKKDELGNILMIGEATPGYENLPTVVLQAHMDMVCEKNNDTVHDFDNDPIVPWIDGDWVRAKGTTLGADDGMGVAAALAILTDKSVAHGKIEALFTVDEETCLTGAYGLKSGFFTGKKLLNLDSEDEDIIFIGCAGGMDTVVTYPFQTEAVAPGQFAVNVSVRGLQGGHSGGEIDKGRSNALKVLANFLWECAKNYNAKIATISGGNLRNAIPREADAVIVFDAKYKEDVRVAVNCYSAECASVCALTDPGVKVDIESVEVPAESMTAKCTIDLVNALLACPHGVQTMSAKMPGLVESSTNLASIKVIEGNKVYIQTSQRSAIDSQKKEIARAVGAAFEIIGAEVKHGDGYPGWDPNPNSELLKAVVESFKNVYNGEEPVVTAIHAGLECGLFLEKYPGMDMISTGPTLAGVHSPDEKCYIPSVERWYNFLKEVLVNIK